MASTAAGLVAAALVGILMSLTGGQGTPLTATDVQGTWSAPGGGHLTVRPDGSAQLQRASKPAPDCGLPDEPVPSTYSGPATWVFDTYPDESPGIRLDYPAPLGGKTCRIYLSVLTSDEHGTRGYFAHDGRSYARDTPQAD